MRRVLCQRSIFPVVVGVRGRVSRVVMPFSRQIRSNSTSDGRGRVNLPVNCLPLSESTSPGIPCQAREAANAAHTARPVARVTSWAITQYREWSSMPDTSLTSVPSDKNTPPMMATSWLPARRGTATPYVGLFRRGGRQLPAAPGRAVPRRSA